MSNEPSAMRIIFDPTTRELSYSPRAAFATQKDLGVDAVQFECPATYGGLKLKNYRIRIKYINAKGQRGIALPENVTEADGKLTYTWQLKEHVTRFKGTVRFNLTFMLVDDNATIVQQFSSRIAEVPVYDGIEAHEQPSDKELQDIITEVFGLCEPLIDQKVAEGIKAAFKGAVTEVASRSLQVTQLDNDVGKTIEIDAVSANKNDIKVLFD